MTTIKRALLAMLCVSLMAFSVGYDDDDTDTPVTPAGEMGDTPEGGTPTGGTPEGETPAGGTPEGGTPEGGTPEGGTPAGGEEPMTPGTIVEVARAAGGFDTLLTAVEAAGLVDVLNGEGPFTVLAPTDDAFAALPEGVVETLVMDAMNGDTGLASVLQAHVVADAAVLSSELSDGQVVSTLNGDVTINVTEAGVTVTMGEVTANVVMADIEASNGVIHVIDAVIVP